ncbi:MAG: DUF58 domain-containing protein [Planctomycetota bacterium]
MSTTGPDGARVRIRERRYRLRLATLLYMALTLFLAIGAVNSQNNLLFFAFGIAIAGMLVSGLLSASLLGRLGVRRISPPLAAVGEDVEIVYRVTNRSSRMPALALLLVEPIAGERSSDAVIASIPYIAPRGSVRVVARGRARRRGVFPLVGPTISSGFPFGLFGKSIAFRDPDQLVVAPRKLALKVPPPTPAGRGARSVSVAMAREGGADEFLGLRDYRPGDPARKIAWKASTRHGRLVTRQTAALATQSVGLTVLPPPPDDPIAFERTLALIRATLESIGEPGRVVELRAAWLASGTERVGANFAVARERSELLSRLAAASMPDETPAIVVPPEDLVIGYQSRSGVHLAAARLDSICEIPDDATELGPPRDDRERSGWDRLRLMLARIPGTKPAGALG